MKLQLNALNEHIDIDLAEVLAFMLDKGWVTHPFTLKAESDSSVEIGTTRVSKSRTKDMRRHLDECSGHVELDGFTWSEVYDVTEGRWVPSFHLALGRITCKCGRIDAFVEAVEAPLPLPEDK